MRLVSVVTRTRSSHSMRRRASFMRSSIWPAVGRTSTGRVDEPGRPDDLLGDVEALAQLERPGRGADEDDLRHLGDELVEAQRPVVEGARQPEAVVDERLLAGAVAFVHAVDLGHRHVRFVDEDEEVAGEEVEQAVGRGPGLLAEQDARVVLDAVAEAHLAQHLHVVLGALPQTMRFEDLVVLVEPGAALVELALDLGQGALDGRAVGDEVGRRVDGHVLRLVDDLAAHRVVAHDRFDLVAPQLDPQQRVLVGRPDFERVAAHAELAARGFVVVALVLDVDQLAQHGVAVDVLAGAQEHHALQVVVGRAQAEDAAHAGHDDGVAPHEQGVGGGVAQAVDLVVDRRVLLDVEVALRERRPRAGSSRSSSRSTRRRCPAGTRGTRCRAGPRASCCGRSRGSACATGR